MKQVINLRTAAGVNLGISTTYFHPFSNQTSTEANSSVILPVAGVVRRLKVHLSAAPGSSRSRTFSVRINGVNTALSVVVSGASATTGSDYVNDITVAAGDRFTIEAAVSGIATSASARISYEFEADGGHFYTICGTEINPSTSVQNYASLTGGNTGWTDAFKRVTMCPHTTTIKSIYAEVSAAPGVGTSWRFSIFKNGVEETGSRFTIADSATTGNITGLSISVSQGDRLQMGVLPSGTPSAATPRYGTLFQPSIPGESLVPLQMGDLGTSNQFISAYGIDSTILTGETNITRQGFIRGKYKKLTVELSVAPGAGTSRTFTLRNNLANVNSTVTVSNTDTTGQDNTNSDGFKTDDQITIGAVPTSSPAATSFRGAMVHYIPVAQKLAALGCG